MKKFKGGLYADLGNYKTSLPNTEILNNFFASNPVGYKSGGIVRGVAGGNSTGMKVTGGFLNNAQRYAPGGEVSSYYSPSNVGVRPGDFKAKGNQNRLNVIQQINDLYAGNKYRIGQAKKNRNNDYQRIANMLKIPLSDVENAFTDYSDPVETYKGEKAYKGDKGKSITKDPDRPSTMQVDNQVSTGLEQLEGDISGEFMSKEKPVLKKPSQNPDYVKDMLSQGVGGIGDFDIDQFNQMKKDSKDKKGFLDPKKIITKSDDSSSTNGETEKTNGENKKPVLTKPERDSSGDSVFKGGTTFDKMTEEGLLEKPRDANEMVDELFTNNEDYQKLINNYSDASEADKAALKKIGEEYYGKDKGKEAPAWAMPLMMMGLNMAASNNPDMLGAMAEGGIKGVEQYAKQQKEKKDEAKEKIELDLKKINKSIEINSRDLDFTKDMATIKSNIINQSMQIASNEMINYNNNLRTAIQADSDRELEEYKIKEQSMINWAQLDAKYDIANTEIDFKYMELMDKKEARKDDLTYKQDVLKVEIAKHNNDWQKHLNLVNLEKVSTGKTTTIMMPDADGNVKAHKVQVYLNKETGKFESKVLGFAPPDADYLESITDDIRESFANNDKYIDSTPEELEAAIAAEIQRQLNDKYGDIDSALEE